MAGLPDHPSAYVCPWLREKKKARERFATSVGILGCLWGAAQGSRYIYDLYYEKEAISKKLYEWLLKNNYADAMLIAKWKKQGYEKLCCLRCIQTKETNFNSTCICRVPREQLKQDQEIECVSCGCRGCSSND